MLILLTGSYSTPEEKGVCSFSFDEITGEFHPLDALEGISNPSFLYPWGERIYVASEDDDKPSAWYVHLDEKSGSLQIVNSQSTLLAAPCNIIVSPDGKYAYTSNYAGASITEFSINEDGVLEKGKAIHFTGSSVHPRRQRQPYIHAVNFTPDGKYLLANDLGTDQIHILPYDSQGVKEEGQKDFFVKAGAGPRHLCWHPNGQYAYLISELSGEVFVLAYSNGNFDLVQTLKVDETDASGSADIHITKDGKFLYTSHRLKNDGIAIMRVMQDGKLEKIGYQLTGIHPRHFMLTPNEKYMLVACRDTNEVEIYQRDFETGMLQKMEHTIKVSKPVCVQFVELDK